MEKTRLLIADQDARFADLAKRFLQSFPDIELLGINCNGQDAYRNIRTLHPDAVLFDLVLPGIDGIALLSKVNDLNNPPAMICCTRFYSDVALEALRDYGAAYVMFKPVELQSLRPAILACSRLHKKMKQISNLNNNAELNVQITGNKIHNYIVSLGIPSKLIGCSYLTEAIRLAHSDLSLTKNLSKGLYLEISRSMNSSPTRIERCIRNAISAAYQSGALEGKMPTCPSNKEFINYILRTIAL